MRSIARLVRCIFRIVSHGRFDVSVSGPGSLLVVGNGLGVLHQFVAQFKTIAI